MSDCPPDTVTIDGVEYERNDDDDGLPPVGTVIRDGPRAFEVKESRLLYQIHDEVAGYIHYEDDGRISSDIGYTFLPGRSMNELQKHGFYHDENVDYTRL